MKHSFINIKYSLNPFEKSILSHFLILSNPKLVLELGIHKGSTTKYICETLIENGIDSMCYGFDYDTVINDLLINDRTIKTLVDSDKLQLIPGTLPESLETFLNANDKQIDFVLIDATGDYHNVYGELCRIWPYISKNGYINW